MADVVKLWPAPLSALRRFAGVPIPGSAAARAAERICRSACDWELYAHSARTFLWAAVVAGRSGQRCDRELLFVASLLHCVGLTDSYRDPERPFEHAGADIAADVAGWFGWPARRREAVHLTVALQCTAAPAAGAPPEASLLLSGLVWDAADADAAAFDERATVAARFPRERAGCQYPLLAAAAGGRRPIRSAAYEHAG